MSRVKGSHAFGCLTLLLVGLNSLPIEAGTKREVLAVPGVGGVVLEVPSDWQCETGGPAAGPTLRCGREDPGGFAVLVTAIPARPGAPTADEELRASVEGAGNEALPTAQQTKLELRRVQGAVVAGYVYSLTDRSPEKGPGDYRELTQGLLSVGHLNLSVTILTHTGDAQTVESALAMLSATRALAGESEERSAEPEPDRLVVGTLQDSFELSVPVSRLVMRIPRGNLQQQQDRVGGAGESPRYFYFSDDAGGLRISGWFESEAGFTDVQRFWKGETAAWKATGSPEPVNVSFEQIGSWQAILYDLAVPGLSVSNTHIRAHWVQAGTWIDVHLSLTSNDPLPGARRALRSVLEGIRVQERQP